MHTGTVTHTIFVYVFLGKSKRLKTFSDSNVGSVIKLEAGFAVWSRCEAANGEWMEADNEDRCRLYQIYRESKLKEFARYNVLSRVNW